MSFTRVSLQGLLSVLACCVLSDLARGQGTFATITGVVRDPSGAVVPKAVIEATQIERNFRHQTLSNEDGQYTLANLVEGTYTLTVKASGFQEHKVDNIILSARDIRRVDASLTVGAVGTVVEVTGGATLIETETARIAGTKEREIMRALPLTLRRAWDYFTMTPTIERTSGWSIRFSGTGNNQGEATLDGTTLATAFGGPIGPLMDRTELVQEMRIDVAQSTAEHSTMGQVALVSRSGTNDFHGTAADYYSNAVLNSRNPFNLTKGKGGAHQLIFSAGGPIYLPRIYDGRNKSFFFSTLEIAFGSRGIIQVNRSVPLPSWRNGDFTNLTTPVRDPLDNLPFPGNRIPTTRLNPVSLKYQERYIPQANYGSTDVLAPPNYRAVYPGFPFVHQPTMTHRIDHRFSEKQFLYGRITSVRWNFDQPETAFPQLTPKSTNQRNMDALTLAHTYSFTPTLLNEFRYGLGLQRFPSQSAWNAKAELEYLGGLQGLAPNIPDVTGIHRVDFSGVGLDAISTRDSCEPCNQDAVHSFLNDVSWFRGKHNWKFGANVRLSTWTTLRQGAALLGQTTFSNRFTGHPYADFMLGYGTTLRRNFPAIQQDIQRWSLGFYVNDTWKPTPKLTLNLGLRWDAQLPWSETNGRMAAFDINGGRIVIPDGSMDLVSPLMPRGYVDVVEASQAGWSSKLISADRNNWQPRVGVAYRPWGNNTVFRAGFGLAYNITPRGVTNTGIPFVINEPDYTNPTQNPLVWPWVFPAAGGSGPSVVSLPSALRRDLRMPRVIQYSATIEHQRWDTGFSLSYVGTGTRQGIYTYNINQPLADSRLFVEKDRRFSRYPDIFYADNGAGHQYHGVTVQALRRPKSGLYYQVFYTWAKDIGDLEDGQSPENAYDRARERAWWERLAMHRFSANCVYELPFGHGKPFAAGAGRILNGLVGGWRLSTIVALESGRALTPAWTGPDPTGTRYTTSATRPNVTLRPDALRNPNIESPGVDGWFDPSAFAGPPVGRFGTSAKGVIVGPGTQVMHNAIAKDFPIRERVVMRVEVLATNTLNHPNWGDPELNVTSTGRTARIFATTDRNAKFDTAIPREMQLHLRFEW
ncbi:MAG: TonB-dependent receptor [Bryobacterales bacterium]|nr:TonB-dependent receptor [Bryobacterales bacterium]